MSDETVTRTVKYNDADLQRAEALMEEIGLTDLSPARWRVELERLQSEGEPVEVLAILRAAFESSWFEKVLDYLEELEPSARKAEIQRLKQSREVTPEQLAFIQNRFEPGSPKENHELLHPGLRIDKYVLGHPLYAPKGGLSLVFHAYQENLERVIKFIHPRLLENDRDESVEQFREELGHLQELDSVRGVVSVIDWGVYQSDTGDSLPYIVTHYIRDGRPITGYAESGGLDDERRLELFSQVCEAIRGAHAKGVVHRDLKPNNILVDLAGQAWVIDFGVADSMKPWLGRGWEPSPGSRQYMSPEHFSADFGSVGFQSDVYSLGLILFELLCGERPYRVNKLGDIINSKPPRLGDRIPRYRGTALEKQIASALAKRPTDRCSLADLHLAVNTAKQATQGEKSLHSERDGGGIDLEWMRRRGPVIGLAGLGLAGVIGLWLLGGLIFDGIGPGRSAAIEVAVTPPTVQLRWEGTTGSWQRPNRIEAYENELRLRVSFKNVGSKPVNIEEVRLIMDSNKRRITWQGAFEADDAPLNLYAIEDHIQNHRTELIPFPLAERYSIAVKKIDFIPVDNAEPLTAGSYSNILQVKEASSKKWRNLLEFTFEIPKSFQLFERRPDGTVKSIRYGYWQLFELNQ